MKFSNSTHLSGRGPGWGELGVEWEASGTLPAKSGHRRGKGAGVRGAPAEADQPPTFRPPPCSGQGRWPVTRAVGRQRASSRVPVSREVLPMWPQQQRPARLQASVRNLPTSWGRAPHTCRQFCHRLAAGSLSHPVLCPSIRLSVT